MLHRFEFFQVMTVNLYFFALVVPFLFGLSFSTQASLRKMADELIKNNSSLMTSKAQAELGALNYESLVLTKTWNLNYGLNHTDSALESISSGTVYSSPSQTTFHTLNLSKDFQFGGNLSFGSSLSKREGQGALPFYSFYQELAYTQSLGRDFFGQSFRKELEKSRLNRYLAKVSYQEDIQRSLLNLVETYTLAGLNLALVELQKEAVGRAFKRLKLIRRWVRDGLRRKVDLYQAEAGFYDQQEKMKSAKLQLEASLERLATSLHRKVSPGEVLSLRKARFKGRRQPRGDWLSNKNLIALEQQQKISQSILEKSRFALLPKIDLTAGYKTNEIDLQRSTALREGKLGGSRDQTSLVLNFSWPLGSLPQSIEKAKARLNLETSKKRLEKTRYNLKESERALKNQIALLDKNIISVKRRLKLSAKALREYNKLYGKGRADLDQVIRAEETLIGTEVSYVNYLAQRERLVHNLSYLFGQLKSFILEN